MLMKKLHFTMLFLIYIFDLVYILCACHLTHFAEDSIINKITYILVLLIILAKYALSQLKNFLLDQINLNGF
jgi:hypothetical protein